MYKFIHELLNDVNKMLKDLMQIEYIIKTFINVINDNKYVKRFSTYIFQYNKNLYIMINKNN